MAFLCLFSQSPNERYAINIAPAISAALIAPLLLVMARPKMTTATAIPQAISGPRAEVSDLRFLNFSKNKATAAKDANSANEPAELLFVKKLRTPLE